MPAHATNNTNMILSELNDEECIAFLEENGVTVPALSEDSLLTVSFARYVIKSLEENPQKTFVFGNPVLSDFAYEIKCAVNNYYGIGNISCYSAARASNMLLDNTVYGSWQDSYTQYNCYAYAIGDTISRNPGQYEWIANGNEAGDYIYNMLANIQTIAGWIEDDLITLGYTVNSVGATKPSVTVNDHDKLICVRKDIDGILLGYDINGSPLYLYDYHVMKQGTDGGWYHKPGETNPLKYKYVPTNDRIWVAEAYDGTEDVYTRDEEFTYDSTIYYIEYEVHGYKYLYCGNTRHILTCTTCGLTTGSAVSCSMSGNTCRVCGHTSGGGFEIMSLDRH